MKSLRVIKGKKLGLLVWTATLAASCPYAHSGDLRPPKPNPADPVDYLAWVNGTLAIGLEDNANEMYLKAADALTPFAGDWGEALDHPWTRNPPVSKWLDANREALAMFRAAAAHRDYFFTVKSTHRNRDPRVIRAAIWGGLPSMTFFRDATRGLTAEGFRAWAAGDHSALPDNAVVALRTAHHLFKRSTFIERLYGTAIAAGAYENMRHALNLSDNPESLAGKLRGDLAIVDVALPPLSRHFLFERVWTWDTCQRLFIRGRKEGTWEIHEAFAKAYDEVLRSAFSTSQKKRLGKIGYEATLREVDAYYDLVDQWATVPFHTTMSAEGKPTGRLADLESLAKKTKNPLCKVVFASPRRSREIHEQITAARNATHLIVHLILHRAEHGAFPKSLGELAIANSSGLRTDPFSGGDLVYKRKQRGKSFMLYSVAHNLKDDDGRHGGWLKDGDFVFWPVQD